MKAEPMGLAGDWVWEVNKRSQDDPIGLGLNNGKDGSVGSCVRFCPAAICSALESHLHWALSGFVKAESPNPREIPGFCLLEARDPQGRSPPPQGREGATLAGRRAAARRGEDRGKGHPAKSRGWRELGMQGIAGEAAPTGPTGA